MKVTGMDGYTATALVVTGTYLIYTEALMAGFLVAAIGAVGYGVNVLIAILKMKLKRKFMGKKKITKKDKGIPRDPIARALVKRNGAGSGTHSKPKGPSRSKTKQDIKKGKYDE